MGGEGWWAETDVEGQPPDEPHTAQHSPQETKPPSLSISSLLHIIILDGVSLCSFKMTSPLHHHCVYVRNLPESMALYSLLCSLLFDGREFPFVSMTK